MLARISRLWAAKQGTAAIEFAIFGPVFVLLFAGIVEFANIFVAYTMTNLLATQYAIAWADCVDDPQGTCSTELSTYTNSYALGNIAPPLIGANISLTMFEVQMAGITPVIIYAYPSGSAMNSTQTTAAQNALTSSQYGVVVTVTYAYNLVYFGTLMGNFLNAYLNPTYTIAQVKTGE